MRIRPTAIAWALLPSVVVAQEPAPPTIDMHLHALAATAQGPPPLAFCLPITEWPTVEMGSTWAATFLAWQREPQCPDPIWSAETDAELMERTLAIMERRNVFAVTSGEHVAQWRATAERRIIPGLLFDGAPSGPSTDSVRMWFEEGRFAVLGEVTIQYRGMEPDDPVFEPYLDLAEELDVPVGMAIQSIESAAFLTESQKRDILYNNAARFLRLSEEEMAAHHSRR